MLILALDTTSSARSCALTRDGALLGEEAGDANEAQATRLPGELVSLLEHLDVGLAEIDAFAVGVGPGSFTGMRVGIATMQGLALATGRPLFGVSALDALADTARAGRASAPEDRVAAWVDAWRGEVYAALYVTGEGAGPVVESPVRLLQALQGQSVLFTGTGAAAHQDVIRAALGSAARFSVPVAPLLAAAMARLASAEYRAGRRPPPDAIQPVYVRRPDAELARNPT